MTTERCGGIGTGRTARDVTRHGTAAGSPTPTQAAGVTTPPEHRSPLSGILGDRCGLIGRGAVVLVKCKRAENLNVIPVKISAAPTTFVLVWISTLGTTGGKHHSDISEVTLQAQPRSDDEHNGG